MRLSFQVAGSAPEPYLVTFERDGDQVFSACTCAAGMAKQACKHRLDLIGGDVTALASDNLPEVNQLAQLIVGSSFALALGRVNAAEAALDQAKRALAAEKKALGRFMHR